MIGVISLEIGVLADICLRMIIREDSGHCIIVDKMLYQKIMLYSLVASIQDIQSREVYDFLHVTALPAGLVFVVTEPSDEKLISLVVFVAVQMGIFMRMYGAGDGLAFLVCAVFESRFGRGMLTYLLHMGTAYILLGIVQGFKHNINKRGNLRKPVPFLPYITVSVWLFL